MGPSRRSSCDGRFPFGNGSGCKIGFALRLELRHIGADDHLFGFLLTAPRDRDLLLCRLVCLDLRYISAPNGREGKGRQRLPMFAQTLPSTSANERGFKRPFA